MALPSIGQAQMLAETLEALVKRYVPQSVAILGCAGGNGFERLMPLQLDRIVGLDINPQYVATARERFGKSLPQPELYVADLQSTQRLFEPVEFVYAALVFEYVEIKKGLSFASRHCAPGGIFATVMQRRDADEEWVSPSPYSSLLGLESVFRWVAPERFQAEAERVGFALESSDDVVAGGGKGFSVQVFRRPGGD